MRRAVSFSLRPKLAAIVLSLTTLCIASSDERVLQTSSTDPSTCPIPQPPPADGRADEPICALCPEGTTLDPAKASDTPLSAYASEIANALAQAGQADLIPEILSHVTCDCGQLEYLFSSTMMNDLYDQLGGGADVEQSCGLFQLALGTGGIPGGPAGCCKDVGGGNGGNGGGDSSVAHHVLGFSSLATLSVALVGLLLGMS